MKKLSLIFVLAFIFNVVWEFLHAQLYVHYQGGPITSGILLRAALFDAVVTSLFAYPFLRIDALKRRQWLLAVTLVVFAAGLELWALSTGRWAYKAAMPVIPLLGTGLTPTVQLGLLGYLALRFSVKKG